MKYLLILLVPLVIGEVCTGPYVDADAKHQSDTECIVTENGTNYVRNCNLNAGQCDKFDGTCYNYTKYDGDVCTQNTECPLNNCVDGYCKAAGLGANCNDHRECAIGLFCDTQSNRTCQAQKEEGQSCSDIFYCQNHLTCDFGSKKCIQLFSSAEGAACDDVFGLSTQWSWQCQSGYCNKLSQCQNTNLPTNNNTKCSVDSDCKLSTGDQGVCQCSFTEKGENYCAVQPGDKAWSNVVSDVKDLLLPFLKKTTNVCHTRTRFSTNCWVGIKEAEISFGVYTLESSQAFQLNGAQWSELSQVTFSSLFPTEQSFNNLLNFDEKCYNYNCTNKIEIPQCIQYNSETFWINEVQCSSDYYCPASQAEQNQNCAKKQDIFQWHMPGQYCENSGDCYPQTTCESHHCVGKEETSLCSGKLDYSCAVGLACIKNSKDEQYTCQKQLETSQACEIDFQCTNDALCEGGVCISQISQENGAVIKGQCAISPPNVQMNYVCKSLQCQQLNDTHFKCIPGYKSTGTLPKQASYVKDCVAVDQDYVEYSNINCSYSQTNANSYCGAHLGDDKGIKLITAFNAVYNLSQGICHTTQRLDAECWYNRLNKYWDSYVSYYSLNQEFLNYPQLDNADICTKYVYFNDYYNVNYNAKEAFEEKSGNAIILSFAFFLLALIL